MSTLPSRSRSTLGRPANGIAKQPWYQAALAPLKKLTKRQIAVLVGAVLVAVILANQASKHSHASDPIELLAAKIDPDDVRDISQLLDSNNIEHKISDSGDTITVAPTERQRARTLLFRKHLPRHLAPLPTPSMTMTSSAERARRNQALQRDLADTVRCLDGVADATVNIAFPAEKAFESTPVTAAVVLHMEYGKQMSPEGVHAITSLVAASVPDLEAKSVKVVDGDSNRDLTQDYKNMASAARANWKVEAEHADYLRKEVQERLDKVLGAGRTQIAVRCSYDFSRQESKTDIPGASGSVLKTRNSREEGMKSEHSSSGPEDRGGILDLDKPEGGKKYDHKIIQEVFENSHSENRIITEEPRLSKINAGVYFDNLPLARVAELTKTVASELGIDPSRGDTLEVSNVPFSHDVLVPTPPPVKVVTLPAPDERTTTGALAGLAALALLAPAGLIWMQNRSRGVITDTTRQTLPGETGVDLADLVHCKMGVRAENLIDTQVSTSPDRVQQMATRELAEQLRTQWLGKRD